MQEKISEHLQLARERYRELHQQLFIYSVKHSGIPGKSSLLGGRVSDPSIAVNIGTPAFFRETVLTTWRLHQEFLTEHERRLGEGKLMLLWNLMGVNSETEAIPPKEDINAWADNLDLLSPMVVTLMVAAGYGEDSERVRSEQYYDDYQLLGERLGESKIVHDLTLPETIRVYAYLLANDFTKLASHILNKIRR